MGDADGSVMKNMPSSNSDFKNNTYLSILETLLLDRQCFKEEIPTSHVNNFKNKMTVCNLTSFLKANMLENMDCSGHIVSR